MGLWGSRAFCGTSPSQSSRRCAASCPLWSGLDFSPLVVIILLQLLNGFISQYALG